MTGQIDRAADDSRGMDEITDSLGRAFDRVDDFEAVQSGASDDELLDAVALLQESVGIGDAARDLLRDRLAHLDEPSRAWGHVLLGLIVGLTAAELESDPPARVRG